jgi:hypothetical protein
MNVKLHSLPLAVLALCAVGCQRGAEVAVAPTSEPNVEQPTAAAPQTPGQEGQPPATEGEGQSSAPPAASKDGPIIYAPDGNPARALEKAGREAVANAPNVEIAGPRVRGWQGSNAAPVAVATQVGEKIRKMKNTFGEFEITAETPVGRGLYKGRILVRDASVYQIDYVQVAEEPIGMSIVSDGQQRIQRTGTDWQPPRPLAIQLPNPGDPVQVWPKRFPEMIFQGLTESRDPWKPLIEGWAKGQGEYDLNLEEKKTQHNGREFHSYRILAKRKPAAAKRLGHSELEIVVDAKYMLPTTIRSIMKEPDGKEWRIQWSARYGFNREITINDFEAPIQKHVRR